MLLISVATSPGPLWLSALSAVRPHHLCMTYSALDRLNTLQTKKNTQQHSGEGHGGRLNCLSINAQVRWDMPRKDHQMEHGHVFSPPHMLPYSGWLQ